MGANTTRFSASTLRSHRAEVVWAVFTGDFAFRHVEIPADNPTIVLFRGGPDKMDQPDHRVSKLVSTMLNLFSKFGTKKRMSDGRNYHTNLLSRYSSNHYRWLYGLGRRMENIFLCRYRRKPDTSTESDLNSTATSKSLASLSKRRCLELATVEDAI